MIRQILIIARKEIVDHARERRSVAASAMHLLMGPLVILVISFSPAMSPGPKGAADKLGPWTAFVPIAGQQAIAVLGMTTGHWPFAQAFTLALATAWLTVLTVVVAGKMLERDSVVYGR